MFEAFRKAFSKDEDLSVEDREQIQTSHGPVWTSLIDSFGGVSFEQGLYRVIRGSDEPKWNSRVVAGFPEFDARITCFGFDWLGRVFAVDASRSEHGQPGVVMFEPGTGEALDIPCNIGSFHDQELIEFREAALASDFYKRWLLGGGSAPHYQQCIGYAKPLFLGGADDIFNLELSDIDVYWHLLGQLILASKRLSSGTGIRVDSL